MAKFYVCTKTAWSGSEWSPVAGPFDSKAEAIERAAEYADDTADLRDVVYASVQTRTELRNRGYRDDNRLAEMIADAKRAKRWEDEDAEKAAEYAEMGIY